MRVRMRTIEEIREFSESKCRQVQLVLKCAEFPAMHKFLQFHGQWVDCLPTPVPQTSLDRESCDLPNALYWLVVDTRILIIYNRTSEFRCCQHMLDID